MSKILPRCAALTKAGSVCRNRVRRPGDVTCAVHEGVGPSVDRARQLLEQEAVSAAAALVALVEDGRPEDSVRLRAAESVLARSVPESRVVEHRVRVDPLVVLAALEETARLRGEQRRLLAQRRRAARVPKRVERRVDWGRGLGGAPGSPERFAALGLPPSGVLEPRWREVGRGADG